MTKMRISIQLLMIMMTAFSGYSDALTVGNTTEKQSIFNLAIQGTDLSDRIDADEPDFDQDPVINNLLVIFNVIDKDLSDFNVIAHSAFFATHNCIRAPPHS